MSSPSEGQLVNQSFRFTGFIFVRMSTIYLPKSVFSDFRSVSVGGPVHCTTRSIWFRVECPGNIGFPLIISPIMQPKLHTSAALEYFLEPSRI